MEFAAIDASAPDLNLPMCRSLYRPPSKAVLDVAAIEEGAAELDLAALFKQTSVDERLLRSHIADLLKSRPQVTLAEVAEAYPPQQGLAEVVTYLRIAAYEGAPVDDTITESVVLPASGSRPGKHVRVPRVIFTR
jgi:hypothetical protein